MGKFCMHGKQISVCRIHEAASRFSKHQKNKTSLSGISSNMLPAEKTRITEIGKRSNNKLIIAPQRVRACQMSPHQSDTQLLINLTRRTQSSPHMRRCRCSFSPKTHLNGQLEQPDAYQRSLHNMHNHNHRRTCPRIYPSSIPSLQEGIGVLGEQYGRETGIKKC